MKRYSIILSILGGLPGDIKYYRDSQEFRDNEEICQPSILP